MKVALVGYGKMGKMIEQCLLSQHHEISFRIYLENASEIHQINVENTDVVIEFTHHQAVVQHLNILLSKQLPVVCGTTGWYDQLPQLKQKYPKAKVIYGANFSLGVAMFTKTVCFLAELMNQHPQYDCAIEERHHNQKADAPSGTAIQLANHLIAALDRKTCWKDSSAFQKTSPQSDELSIGVVRCGSIPGTHTVLFQSVVDSIELSHQAYSRDGFATGAVWAAEKILQLPSGWYSFQELF